MSEEQPPEPAPKAWKRANYVPAPHFYKLNQACVLIDRAFSAHGHVGIYLVGSSLERRDYRDVDVRLMMEDAAYDHLFHRESWTDAFWSLLCTSISDWLQQQTGLPIDFQIQRMTEANEKHGSQHGKKRSALGIFIDYPGERPSDIKPEPPPGT